MQTPPLQAKQQPRIGRASTAQDRTSVYIDDLSGEEVGQVRSQEENWTGDFLWCRGSSQWNRRGDSLNTSFRLNNGIRHVCGDPSRSDRIHENVVPGELRR